MSDVIKGKVYQNFLKKVSHKSYESQAQCTVFFSGRALKRTKNEFVLKSGTTLRMLWSRTVD